jgi:hypothetical protein
MRQPETKEILIVQKNGWQSALRLALLMAGI